MLENLSLENGLRKIIEILLLISHRHTLEHEKEIHVSLIRQELGGKREKVHGHAENQKQKSVLLKMKEGN